jgi:hypothetical protein
MSIRLTALDDSRRAEIHTMDGVLRGSDHLVEISDLLDGDLRAERTA